MEKTIIWMIMNHSFAFLNSNEQDITFYNTGESAAYNITIDKGGNDLNMLASATLKVLNEFDIEYYNNENKTNFKPLPADCYELPSDMTVSFWRKKNCIRLKR